MIFPVLQPGSVIRPCVSVLGRSPPPITQEGALCRQDWSALREIGEGAGGGGDHELGEGQMSTYNMNTIWKFPFEIIDRQEVKMPTAIDVLHVGLDPQGAPCIWAKVDSTKNLRPWVLWVVGTGHPLPEDGKPGTGEGFDFASHIGSFVQGPFVWHVFLR